MEVLQRTANRGSISDGGYEIGNSCKFEPDNSEAFNTTNQAAGNRKTWTFSAWVKRSELGSLQTIFGAGDVFIRFDTPDVIQTYAGGYVTTNRKFRDTSAWYHIVWLLDTTQSTASNRSRLYVNGVQETSFSGAAYPDQNADLDLGGQGASSNWIQVGRWYAGGRLFSGYMAEVHYVNGTVAEPTAFGEFDEDSGIWKPKKYTGGGYGTQGFYYKFDDSSSMGKDSSGEGHNANSVENITAADQSTDTPTNNFATLNPLFYQATKFSSITNGNTTFTSDSGTTFNTLVSTIGMSSGKYYFEVKRIAERGLVGITDVTRAKLNTNSTYYPGDTDNSVDWGYYSDDGKVYNNGNPTGSGATWGNGDIVGCAVDLDNRKIYWHKNGSYINSGNPSTGANGQTISSDVTYYFAVAGYTSTTFNQNFGNGFFGTTAVTSSNADAAGHGLFEYAVPTGYFSLNTKNLNTYG